MYAAPSAVIVTSTVRPVIARRPSNSRRFSVSVVRRRVTTNTSRSLRGFSPPCTAEP
jgi:hypothetical protein